jgi:hypothetical protein
MTDRQQLERLMAIVKQYRESQATYFRGRKTASPDQAKALFNDSRMKGDSLDNLVKQLERQGYQAVKHEENITLQGKMF